MSSSFILLKNLCSFFYPLLSKPRKKENDFSKKGMILKNGKIGFNVLNIMNCKPLNKVCFLSAVWFWNPNLVTKLHPYRIFFIGLNLWEIGIIMFFLGKFELRKQKRNFSPQKIRSSTRYEFKKLI